jgi:hypothetical protein
MFISGTDEEVVASLWIADRFPAKITHRTLLPRAVGAERSVVRMGRRCTGDVLDGEADKGEA